MRSLNTLALFVGFAAVAGCSDNSSINGVFPSSGFLGRTVRVEVSGDNVSWKDGASLDFGPGVTVGAVRVASPSSIFADVTVSDTATPGLRDVVVSNGGDALTLAQSFELNSPLDMNFQGKLAQGSVVSFTARNLDFFSPFDTTCGASFFGICLLYTNMKVVVPAGVFAMVGGVDAYTVTGTLYIDTDASGGPVSLVSGPETEAANQVISPVGKPTDIAARAAVALQAGTATTGTVAEAFDSQLYEYTASGMSLARFRLQTNNQDASPMLFILPETGHFLDMLTASDAPNAVSSASDKFFAVYVDQAGASGYSYGLKVNPLPMMALAEAANDTAATAQVAPGQTVYFGPATLSSGTDQDWIKIPVATGDTAKKVHVFTTGSDQLTDTIVEIYKNTGNAADMIGEGDDSGYHEDVTSDALGAGVTVIYVKVGASSYFQAQHNSYVAAIWLE